MSIKLTIREFLPRPVWRTAAYVYRSIQDAAAHVSGRGTMMPDSRKVFVGSGDFQQIGEEFRGYFIEFGGLRPEHSVLDVGCGIGRMALPLTEYLHGPYRGFDLVADGVRWCQQNITPRHPNFTFSHADVYNKLYNPMGKVQAKDFTFPCADASVDFVFLTSVFTHMKPVDVERYLREVGRVLRPGRRCLATFFLLDAQSRSLAKSGRSSLVFRHDLGGFHATDRRVPEEAIAYDEEDVRALFAACGLRIVEPIRHGKWSGREDGLSYQDICVAVKG